MLSEEEDSLCNDSGSGSESDSYSSIQADLERFSDFLTQFTKDVDTLGENLGKIQKPIENIEMEQLANVPFLEQSPFRTQTFLLQISIPGIVAKRRYPFHEICSFLRNYVLQKQLVQEDGSIAVNEELRKIFSLEATLTNLTYFDLMLRLKKILV
jgi:hypothetical protein